MFGACVPWPSVHFGAAIGGSCQAGHLPQTPQQLAVTPNSRVQDDGGRRQAALAGHTGDEATARGALDADRAETRATALGALARLGRLTDADLERALSDRAPAVRRRACELAVSHAGIELTALLRDPETLVVEAAAWCLGERGDTAAVSALSDVAVNHDEPLCREAAVAALGAIGDPAGLAAILQATSDKPAVRRRAVIALAPFDGPDVDAALHRALEDRDWQVRQAAEDLLRD